MLERKTAQTAADILCSLIAARLETGVDSSATAPVSPEAYHGRVADLHAMVHDVAILAAAVLVVIKHSE